MPALSPHQSLDPKMNTSALTALEQLLLPALANPPAEARRLFHGRGRRWPGLEQLTVDWLQGQVLVSVFKAPSGEELQALEALLLRLAGSPEWAASGAHALILQLRYLPGSPSQWLVGEGDGRWVIEENGLRYGLELGRSQNHGLFLDMREGRRWVREHAQGKRVLNLFAYTCAFSVCAVAGGAEHVINLDMARAALARGRDNHRLNGHDLGRVSFLGHDLFKSWGKVLREGPYDLVIIDPPSFQKGSFVLTQDYRKVLRKLPDLLTAQGQVLACMNDPQLGADYLLECMASEAPGLRFAERLANPAEFQDADPEGGLKVLLFERSA